jgi:peptidoglycan/xylan/chitin deacetylase (PgdA/CDA1 family)
LTAAHVTVPAGRVLAFASHRPLGSDGHPGHVLVNGDPATPATPLSAGDVVSVVAGADRVEPTRTATIEMPAPNPSNLYVGGTAGRAVVRVGTRSGEHVITKVLTEPRSGHLVSPGAVALTFDDGPNPTWTPQVLDLLAKAHVHATFCLIGKQAAAYPQLVRAIVAGGHTLCDHTWDHDQQLPSRPAGQIALNISQGAAAIRKAAGVAPVFFRAPGGNWSATVEAAARAQHMTPLKWTVDPRDWSRPGVAAILTTVYADLRPGGVILMHDGGGDRAESVAALKVLLTRLPAMGYHFIVPPT